jgi:hypothetical protein
MKALPMVVGHEFLDDVPKVALAVLRTGTF